MTLRCRLLILLLLTIVTFGLSIDAKGQARVKKESFGKTSDGQGVDIYTLTNSHGVEAKLMNYGGIVTNLAEQGWRRGLSGGTLSQGRLYADEHKRVED